MFNSLTWPHCKPQMTFLKTFLRTPLAVNKVKMRLSIGEWILKAHFSASFSVQFITRQAHFLAQQKYFLKTMNCHELVLVKGCMQTTTQYPLPHGLGLSWFWELQVGFFFCLIYVKEYDSSGVYKHDPSGWRIRWRLWNMVPLFFYI